MKYDPSGDQDFLLDKILNDGIEFDDNMRGAFLEFDTEESVQELVHNLGTVPIGFLVIYKEADIDLWAEEPTLWNNQSLLLRSSAPNVTVRIFVM